jgi:hypothetical protein
LFVQLLAPHASVHVVGRAPAHLLLVQVAPSWQVTDPPPPLKVSTHVAPGSQKTWQLPLLHVVLHVAPPLQSMKQSAPAEHVTLQVEPLSQKRSHPEFLH